MGESERDAVAVRRQDAFSEREDRAVHDERAGRRGAGQQTPEPLGPLAEEVTDAIRRCREIIVERRVERVDQIGRHRIADDAIAIAIETDRCAVRRELSAHVDASALSAGRPLASRWAGVSSAMVTMKAPRSEAHTSELQSLMR